MTSIRKNFTMLAVVTALVVAALLMLQPAGAASFNEQVSGNFIDTSIDTNGDGTAANYFSGAARGTGSPTYEGLVEIAFGATGQCGPGELEGEVVAYSIVRRYSNGDLAYSRLDTSVLNPLCFNPAMGTATVEIHANVTGGTGKFAGATGSYVATYDVRLLVPDPAGGIGHGSFTGTTSG